jgi:hypothetical protein
MIGHAPSRARRGDALALFTLAVAVGCAHTAERDSTIELAIAPYDVPPGAEMLRCHEMTLPSGVDVDVDRITWAFSEGAHHVHVYVAASGETDAAEKTYDCFQALDFDKWHLLAASQERDFEWALPEGVAIHAEARRSILIQTHYLNTGGDTIQARGSVTLRAAEPGSVHGRAAAIFGQNRDICVPPHATGRVEAECTLPGGGDILAMMGHYHRHGRKFRMWVEPEGKDPMTVYENMKLSEPTWRAYEGLHLGPNDRFGWSCDYENALDVPLVFGPLEDTQEHCNLFAFYTRDGADAEFVPCVVSADAPP